MKKRSEAVALRKRSDVLPPLSGTKTSAAERTLPLLPEGATVLCPECLRENPAKDATRRADGSLECPECGAPCELTRAQEKEVESIPDRRASQSALARPHANGEAAKQPKAYCNECGTEWLRVDGRPFPNCGHTDGFIYDPAEAKNYGPPAGHPQPPPPAKKAPAPDPQRPPPSEARLPVRAPELVTGKRVEVAVGKMVFKLGDYGVNLTVGPFDAAGEVADGEDHAAAGMRLLAQLRQLADTAFAEQLAWYASRLGIIEKKLNG